MPLLNPFFQSVIHDGPIALSALQTTASASYSSCWRERKKEFQNGVYLLFIKSVSLEQQQHQPPVTELVRVFMILFTSFSRLVEMSVYLQRYLYSQEAESLIKRERKVVKELH